MIRRLKIGTKILFVTISISLVAILVTSIVAGLTARNALEHAAFERLTAVRELKAQQIEDYFGLISNQVNGLATDRTTVTSLHQLRHGIKQIEVGLEDNKSPLSQLIYAYYSNDYASRLRERGAVGDNTTSTIDLMPSATLALFLQNSYILEGSEEAQRDAVLPSQQDSYYRTSHEWVDDYFRIFSERNGYHDVFLIEPNKGRIIYSVAKEIDFGTSLLNGPHNETNLARVVKEAMDLNPGEYAFADFEPYAPSFGAPAAFIAAPVHDANKLIGVVAFQMPVDNINAIMTSNEAWADVGLGASGETYLVGQDLLLRNQSRFLIEDRDQYLEMIRAIGTPEEIVQKIENLGDSIGLQTVDTVGTRAALAGKTGEQIFPDYRGVEVLSSYKPLNLVGLDWVLMSEIDRAEAFAASDTLIDYLVLLASVILAVTIYCAYYFSLSLTRPLRVLGGSAASLSSGHLDEPITTQSSDEIGDLAQSFEKTRIALKKTFAEVEQQKAELESKVNQRTAELDAASDTLNLALSSMANGIYMLDKDLNFTLFNDRYAELLEYPPELVGVGKPIRDVVKFCADNGYFGDGDPSTLVEERMALFRSPEGRTVPSTTLSGKTLELHQVPLEGGGVVTVVSDITDLKKQEASLKTQNDELQKIQGDLKESEERIAKIIQSSPDGIITIDKRGIIETFSASAEKIFGYYSDEIVGKNVKILMPKSIALEHDLYLEKYMPGAKSSIVGKKRVVDGLRKDGSVFPLEISVEEVWLGDETIFLGLVQDITERIAMENNIKENAAFQAALLDAVPNAIFVKDTNARFTAFNRTYEEAFGIRREDYLGKTVLDMDNIPREAREAYHKGDVDLLSTGGSSRNEQTNMLADGQEHTSIYLRRTFDLADGSSGGMLGVLIDITDIKEMEGEIIAAREQAENASRTKSAFLANMSHELRTPMNAIIGYSEILAEDAEDAGLDEMLSDLNKISASGKHLLSLINDVLDLSKVEAGKMDLFLETFAVSEMAKDVANTSASLLEKNNNNLALDIAEDVGEMHADTTKIRQLLFNLISNSAKFTTDGTITVGASREIRGDIPWIRFSVRDTGIGIPEDKLDHIFQEFSQADESTTRDFGGTGLGLALTKRFCEMMGGSIKVESEIGVGSDFIITLPAVVEKLHEGLEEEAVVKNDAPVKTIEETEVREEAPRDAIDTVKQETPIESDKPKVLVIDDEKTARDLLQRHLESEGFQVITARGGDEGLAAAAKHRPRLITLDIMMPGMDGWSVLKKLKADRDLKDIPVVMVSMVGDKAMSYALGAVETLQKPVDRSRLHALVSQYSHVANKSALVVDDDPAVRSTVKRFLESEKWRVEEAENGAIGLDKLATSVFDVILLDLMMPVMDGFEFLLQLRGREDGAAATPVIVVTAKDLDSNDRAKLQDNVGHVIQKSGKSLDEVLIAVREALDKTAPLDLEPAK
jgi:PAS domain S-box-containing protein